MLVVKSRTKDTRYLGRPIGRQQTGRYIRKKRKLIQVTSCTKVTSQIPLVPAEIRLGNSSVTYPPNLTS